MTNPETRPKVDETHTVGDLDIRIEIYNAPGGGYKVWPYIVKRNDDKKVHFTIEGTFATVEAARAAALEAGRKLIAQGFDNR
jgi:hypothetical protein